MPSLADLSEIVLFSVGAARITVGSLFVGLLTFVVAAIAAQVVGLMMRRVRRTTGQGRGMLYLVEKVVTYSLIIVGLIAALSSLGLDLSALAVFAGAFGLGIGLGFQGVVKEFVSGLVLIFDRLINIGDYIELDTGRRGIVQEIGPRATRIRTNDNVYILLPNSALMENAVVNWTMRDDVRRIHVPFFVAYGSDKAHVRDVVLAAARSVAFTLPDTADRKTQVWLVGFGESSLRFELVVWPTLEACKRPAAMQAAYLWAIDDALRAADIEIPYPQSELRVRSWPSVDGDASGMRATSGECGAQDVRHDHAATPTTNDAAEDLERMPPNGPAEPVRPPD
jgi:small-conductance mechanosensitive channel